LVFVVVPVSAGVPIYNVIAPASASAVVCGVGFLAFRFWHWAQLTERIERATGIDLPGGLSAAEIEQAPAAPQFLRVEVHDGKGAGEFLELDADLVHDVAAAVYLRGVKFAQNSMTLGDNRPITRSQWDIMVSEDERFRDASWLQMGLIARKGSTEKGGFVITAKGEAILQGSLQGSPPPARG
jgi:hypothetical protein